MNRHNLGIYLTLFIVSLEQEVLDILNDTEGNNTLLRRDTVFAQLNFQLESGIFKLLHDTNIGRFSDNEIVMCTKKIKPRRLNQEEHKTLVIMIDTVYTHTLVEVMTPV